MIEDGYRPTKNGSMTSAAMAFMRDHGVLKDIYSESTGTAHKTAKGTKVSRSEEHTSELQSLMRISYAVFCLKKKKNKHHGKQAIINVAYIHTYTNNRHKHSTLQR